VDVYDALTSARPYKSAWTKDAARDFVQKQRGLMFDPTVVNAFMDEEASWPRREPG
jgi:response regulator RpfG family c-di-GMP phosphodiesterase